MKRSQDKKEQAGKLIAALWPLLPAELLGALRLGSKARAAKHPWCSANIQKVLWVVLELFPEEGASLVQRHGLVLAQGATPRQAAFDAVRSLVGARARKLTEKESSFVRVLLSELRADAPKPAQEAENKAAAQLQNLAAELVEKINKGTAFLVDLDKKEPVFFKACRDNVLRTLVTEVRRAVDKVIEEDVINV